MNVKKWIVALALLLWLVSESTFTVFAAEAGGLKLPAVLASNMVLQRNMPVPIWGWAAPGVKVSVQFGKQTKTAVADTDGKWKVTLRSMPADAQPASMTITAGETITLTNILVGEVWLCSGQSNMEKPIGKNGGQVPTINAPQELATGDQFPQIRLFKVQKIKSATPLSDVKTAASWTVCSSNALETSKFTAVGYFFGRKIASEVKVPVGLVESSWGGTAIELWTPAEAYQAFPSLAAIGAADPGTNLDGKTRLAAIYNAMIIPLAPYAFRGALWYQGEANCKTATSVKLYPDQMNAMITSWRKLWGEGNFPFYYAQLAPFKYSIRGMKVTGISPEVLPEMWVSQTDALRIPKTGMAVITDTVTNFSDIHPARKLEVGERLALIALARDYGKKVEYVGPMFKSVSFSKGEATVKFKHAKGLATRDGKAPDWFQIAGADGKFVDAVAKIDGEKVIVSSNGVAEPKFVRLGWSEVAEPNLMNSAGLTVDAFTTSKWPKETLNDMPIY